MTKMNDAEAIQRAIQEASLSRSQSDDEPFVGAVILNKNGEFIGAAHRGQLEPGDHAEFSLLHKILRSKDRLRGTVLFTTLEPCTTRSHDKLPCAEWIIQKGVERVVIGMLDPNPTICGRGYWTLVDAKVAVEFFPFDLAELVVKQNARFIQTHRGGGKQSSAFAWAIRSKKSVTIAPYLGIGWGDELSLQDCPKTRLGWPLSQVELRVDDRPFVFDDTHRQLYEQYFRHYRKKKRFKDDRPKFMLSQNPIAFSDSPSLSLNVRPTRYSHVQYYRDNIAPIVSQKMPLIENLVRGSLSADFPSAFCMHAIVVTSDNKILLTRRSPKVSYNANLWSVSIEEQLSHEDTRQGPQKAVFHWGQRLLREELGLTKYAYHKDNLRLLSVFLESDVLNTAVCVYVELRIDSKTLETSIKHHPRTDYEFTEWRFLDLDRNEILSELFQPSRVYAPSSGYRLLWTFLKAFGLPKDSELYRWGGSSGLAN